MRFHTCCSTVLENGNIKNNNDDGIDIDDNDDDTDIVNVDPR